MHVAMCKTQRVQPVKGEGRHEVRVSIWFDKSVHVIAGFSFG